MADLQRQKAISEERYSIERIRLQFLRGSFSKGDWGKSPSRILKKKKTSTLIKKQFLSRTHPSIFTSTATVIQMVKWRNLNFHSIFFLFLLELYPINLIWLNYHCRILPRTGNFTYSEDHQDLQSLLLTMKFSKSCAMPPQHVEFWLTKWFL